MNSRFPRLAAWLAYAQRLRSSPLFRGGAFSLLIQVQALPLQFLVAVVLARHLGPVGFGIYSFVGAAIGLVQVMPLSGLDQVVLRYTAQYCATSDWARLRGLWRLAWRASLVYAVPTAALALAFGLFGGAHGHGAISPPAIAASALLLLLPTSTFYAAALRGVHPGVLSQVPGSVLRPWLFALFLAAALLLRPALLGPQAVLLLQGAAVAVVLLVTRNWLRRHRPPEVAQAPAQHDTAAWLRAVVPFALMGGLMLINVQADLLLLGVLGGARDAGIYRVAVQAASLVVLPLNAANLFIAKHVVTLHTHGDHRKLQRLLRLSARSTLLVAALVALAIAVGARWLIIPVLGAAYAGAYAPMLVLCAAQLINVGFGSVGLVLNMTGGEGAAARAAGVAAALNIALNLLLIPRWGSLGAATATLLTMILWNGLMYLQVRRRLGVGTSIV